MGLPTSWGLLPGDGEETQTTSRTQVLPPHRQVYDVAMSRAIPAYAAVLVWICTGVASFLVARTVQVPPDHPVDVGPTASVPDTASYGSDRSVPPGAAVLDPGGKQPSPPAPSGDADAVVTARLRTAVRNLESCQARWEHVRQRMEDLRDRGRVAAQISQAAQEAISGDGLAHLAPLVPSVVDVLLDVGIRPSSLSVEGIEALISPYADYHAAYRRLADDNAASPAEREDCRTRRRDAAREFVARCGAVLPASDREGDFETKLLHRLGE